MTLVVPFDGSDLSKAALVRAAQFRAVFETPLLVVSVIPHQNRDYARERGWIGPNDPYDSDAIVEKLTAMVDTIAPNATFDAQFVGRYAPAGSIGNAIRRAAREADASIVFVGSENAGRIASSLSVGSSIASERSYDTMIVSQLAPSKIEILERIVPTTDASIEK